MLDPKRANAAAAMLVQACCLQRLQFVSSRPGGRGGRVISDVTRCIGTWHGEEFNSIRRRRTSSSRNESDRDDDAEAEGAGTIDRCMFAPTGIVSMLTSRFQIQHALWLLPVRFLDTDHFNRRLYRQSLPQTCVIAL
jgi:hypothetical protein